MGRLKRVRAPLEGGPRKEKKSTMAVDSDVAELIRRVAARDGLQLSDFLDRALQSYIRLNHPDWELEFDEDEDAARIQRRTRHHGSEEEAQEVRADADS